MGRQREVGMSKSTVHRILRVLEQHAFVTQNAETTRFRLGLAGETVLLQVVSPEGDRREDWQFAPTDRERLRRAQIP